MRVFTTVIVSDDWAVLTSMLASSFEKDLSPSKLLLHCYRFHRFVDFPASLPLRCYCYYYRPDNDGEEMDRKMMLSWS